MVSWDKIGKGTPDEKCFEGGRFEREVLIARWCGAGDSQLLGGKVIRYEVILE